VTGPTYAYFSSASFRSDLKHYEERVVSIVIEREAVSHA
jgi:hypothetical protein